MIPTNSEEGGILEVEEKHQLVTLRRWKRDCSWTRPGQEILSFDMGNSVILHANQELDIWDWNMLIKYLEMRDALGATSYSFAEIRPVKKG
jgi:hypothetical protein